MSLRRSPLRQHPQFFLLRNSVEIASKFSAVKELDKRVGELQTGNENAIRNGIIVTLVVLGAAAGVLFLTDPTQIDLSIVVGTVVWLASVYNVHQFIGEYNSLCESERKKQVP